MVDKREKNSNDWKRGRRGFPDTCHASVWFLLRWTYMSWPFFFVFIFILRNLLRSGFFADQSLRECGTCQSLRPTDQSTLLFDQSQIRHFRPTSRLPGASQPLTIIPYIKHLKNLPLDVSTAPRIDLFKRDTLVRCKTKKILLNRQHLNLHVNPHKVINTRTESSPDLDKKLPEVA